MVPPLPKRGASSAGKMPSATTLWFMPAGPYIGALCSFASAGASAKWSKCAWVTKIRSILPIDSIDLKAAGVLGLVVSHGSIMMTLPPGVVMRVAAWPSHNTSVMPLWANVVTLALASAVTASSARRKVVSGERVGIRGFLQGWWAADIGRVAAPCVNRTAAHFGLRRCRCRFVWIFKNIWRFNQWRRGQAAPEFIAINMLFAARTRYA